MSIVGGTGMCNCLIVLLSDLINRIVAMQPFFYRMLGARVGRRVQVRCLVIS